MLPDPHDLPASAFQRLGTAAVAFTVGVKLPPPPLPVPLRQHSVLRAAVPEATIDVDGDLRWAEHDICRGPKIRLGPPVHTEAESAAVKLGPKA
jgi:hypothetical protein